MSSRLVVLASGSGTNAEALMRACADGVLDAHVVAVVTNNPDAGVIDRARHFGVAVVQVRHNSRDSVARSAEDDALIEAVAAHHPDLVVLAGWMRLLGPEVGAALPIINLHPALPGEFAGTRAIERAYDAWRNGSITASGAMIHWVPDGGVDDGPVITTAEVAFEPGDTLEAFADRMHQAEHRLIVDGVRRALAEGKPTHVE